MSSELPNKQLENNSQLDAQQLELYSGLHPWIKNIVEWGADLLGIGSVGKSLLEDPRFNGLSSNAKDDIRFEQETLKEVYADMQQLSYLIDRPNLSPRYKAELARDAKANQEKAADAMENIADILEREESHLSANLDVNLTHIKNTIESLRRNAIKVRNGEIRVPKVVYEDKSLELVVSSTVNDEIIAITFFESFNSTLDLAEARGQSISFDEVSQIASDATRTAFPSGSVSDEYIKKLVLAAEDQQPLGDRGLVENQPSTPSLSSQLEV